MLYSPKKGNADSELPALTKVSRADAESAALKALDVRSASVASGELKAEGG